MDHPLGRQEFSSPYFQAYRPALEIFPIFASQGSNHILNIAGPVILISSMLFWVLSLWLKWMFIYYAVPGAALVKNSNSVPGITDLIWFIGYSIFTLGNGGLIPHEGLWQVISAFVTFSGMGLVSLAITYLLQVISAVENKRSFASQVTVIPKTAEEFVKTDGTGTPPIPFLSILKEKEISLVSEER